MYEDTQLQSLAAQIRGVVFDVDGVLTDGRIIYSDDGRELKQFNVQDGASIKALMQAGIAVAIITGRRSSMVERRAAELGIHHLLQAVTDKAQALDQLINAQQFPPTHLAAVGDDLQDIALFEHPSIIMNATVANAHPAVKDRAHFVTTRAGGEGICVELTSLILKAQNLWPY